MRRDVDPSVAWVQTGGGSGGAEGLFRTARGGVGRLMPLSCRHADMSVVESVRGDLVEAGHGGVDTW